MTCSINQTRRGTILIVTAGIGAILFAMSIAFITRMRSDGEESMIVLQETQARTMLNAALSYVQETARMGWADLNAQFKAESYGWIDTRDGLPGPKDRFHRSLADLDPVTGLALAGGGKFPAVGGRAARCPMEVMMQTPYATQLTYAYNPLPRKPTGGTWLTWATDISYKNLDPMPVQIGSIGPPFDRWCEGDKRPRPRSVGLSWFRVYRPTDLDCKSHRTMLGAIAPIAWSPAVFFLTCGAGATQGFKDWAEVVAEGSEDRFNNDPLMFADMRASERILWYACEWSPAEGYGTSVHTYVDTTYTVMGGYQIPWRESMAQRTHSVNLGGSFLWIERLGNAPDRW